ncbi:YraN family protein [Morganella morganii]|uniref:YraN family protein n=1 Tax=Morganella morganii TaxID=582 RepID=UPI0030FE77F7
MLAWLTGRRHEQFARRWLEQQGLTFVAQNVRFRQGEIDLIMRDSGTWVFTEVRYRRNAHYGGAAASVTKNKQRRLLYAASCWLSQQQLSMLTCDCRFDICAITGDHIDWLKNAFGHADFC